MTRTIISSSNEPSFNLATEEFLLRKRDNDIMFFYINKPSVIIGKHQNALSEINLPYLEEQNIPLYRRLSGGGTVYHDLGNINFCFIRNGETGHLVDFKKATQPIVDVLNEWGVAVRNGERNDLLIDYKKISGNACHVFKRRVMHHGTLLYQSELNKLTASLKSDPSRFTDKAVKSVRSEVMNLSEVYRENLSPRDFMLQLVNTIEKHEIETERIDFTSDEIQAIKELAANKYATPEWNYSYGPSYVFKKRGKANEFVFIIKIQADKGKIENIEINSNHPKKQIIEDLTQAVKNRYHTKSAIKNEIEKHQIDKKYQLSLSELTALFF
ncbi:lipoate--protein ligase family protein [Geofilum sp. OHC36d9]|uniref:lipoate--protein ligase family protein n=1 Tax=Geofilum sp. OHC36d9 TaxID=3458413 RepID=UPI004033DE09